MTFDMLHGLLTIALLVVSGLYLSTLTKLRASQNSSDTASSDSPSENSSAAPQAADSLRQTDPDSALQLLGLLQQEARFLDFTQEEIANYSDAEIGAASRVVHEGCRRVLKQNFDFVPVHESAEQSHVIVPEGFDNSAIRLTGNVTGKAPFSGTLLHRGWKVTDVRLPRLAAGRSVEIIAPAEVDL